MNVADVVDNPQRFEAEFMAGYDRWLAQKKKEEAAIVNHRWSPDGVSAWDWLREGESKMDTSVVDAAIVESMRSYGAIK
ncbi:MAG: hypothetical protein LBP75_01765 [Planctomycetota bacterium]|jgi:hypothetical protein|nr:hypothetical protein [Planctomycetota bacterium]